MSWLSAYNIFSDGFIRVAVLVAESGTGGELPPHLQSIKDSFSSSEMHPAAILLVILAPTVAVLIHYVYRIAGEALRRQPYPAARPEKLFDEILRETPLPDGDKYLLNEMVKGARLKQPAFCLLSPSLMYRTRQLWMEEKGGKVSPDKYQRIGAICEEIFGPESPPKPSRIKLMAK